MDYEFLKAIENVIENCKMYGRATNKCGKDKCGDPEIWVNIPEQNTSPVR